MSLTQSRGQLEAAVALLPWNAPTVFSVRPSPLLWAREREVWMETPSLSLSLSFSSWNESESEEKKRSTEKYIYIQLSLSGRTGNIKRKQSRQKKKFKLSPS